MATVQLSDVIIPAVYQSYTAVNNPETTAFFDSGVAIRNPMLDSAFDGGGKLVDIPYWNDLDPTVEPNYSTDDPTVTATPNKITAGDMRARIAFMNQGYSAADLVSELAGSDPMKRIRDRFGTYWQRQWQRRTIAMMLGILADNIANAGSDMVIDISRQDGLNATDANLFGRKAFTGAAFTLGDHFENVHAIAVHSIIYKRMVDNDDIVFVKPSQGTTDIPTYLGRRVIIDDSMPVTAGTTSGYRYTSILFGAGSLGYGQGTPRVPVEVYRRPDQGNGGGVETIWERNTWIIHPFGYKWNDASLTGGVSPNWADLRNATNWSRQIPRKLVPFSFLVTNG